MGLINAATSSLNSTLGDQFKEFVTCPVTDNNILVARGTVKHGSGNENPSEGVISNGSKIAVPQGFAMMIVDNGAIKEFTAEAGEFIWDTSSEPSVFEGGILKGIGESIKTLGSRFTYGGQTARDQRVYYVNLLNLTGNKFGSTNPEVVSDPMYGSVEITYHGEYSFKVVDPVVLVTNLIGANAKDTITVDEVVGGQLKMQFASNVSTCISDLMIINNIPFTQIQRYKNDVVNVMNNLLDESWRKQYGLEVQDVTLNINATDETKEVMNKARLGQAYSNNMAGMMAAATAESMQNASSNPNGAMMGFMGMNMAQQNGANIMNTAANMGGAQPTQAQPTAAPGEVIMAATAPAAPTADVAPAQEAPVQEAPAAQETTEAPAAKFCSNCGQPVTGKFCSSCGTQVQ